VQLEEHPKYIELYYSLTHTTLYPQARFHTLSLYLQAYLGT